ncbi:APC family permease [Burkholderia pseudomallei]|uniref:APC family permease n=1 Tax=Burkholderia pseudomallei TaxID=28450 RepID=UPI0003D8781A|nr:APC family permease [Burkholderia pseudomallei]AHE36158.1 aspartate-proton symporter [Burkholderia pseudomallei NAU20B-16]AHG36921.1 aspartate-proton symporter [Burkholderia pseudomallei MSHR511]AHG70446.1 aspartate-proton symporter [Burkholderia pseudomallei MSHR146]KGS07597.1 amino acid permease family protein [Burkholderia pseudomallei MSHR7504]KGW29872.1 amino acid permease family protein [Burkholderia pseudomallei MSHR3016]
MPAQGNAQRTAPLARPASTDAGHGKFKKQLSLTDLTFIGLGAIFGSGWLFAASHVSTIAGPAGILSWLLGGFAVLLLGIVYCELGAALPRAGGVVRYPVFSHGPLLGYLMGAITLIAFSSLIAIEVVAARQYAAAWFAGLTVEGSGNPTTLGWLVQAALLCFFFYLNYSSVKTFAKANNVISVFKFVVPLAVIVVLFAFFKPANLTLHGFAPFGMPGVEMAVSAGGIIFAYLGLTPIVSVASEVRDPQRTIPIALILSIVLSTLIYVLLQLAFLGGIPSAMLAGGWHDIGKAFSLPYRDIALALGVGWLAYMVVADAMISPSGCGNIYMNATPRVVYGWAKTGTFFKVFARVDEASGIPRAGLWLTFALALFWTLPFPSWEALINTVSAALVLSYAVAPVSVAALRRTAPGLPRPFRASAFALTGPASFVIAALIVYWSGWRTVSWLLGLQIAMFAVYLACRRRVPTAHLSLAEQVRSCAWLIAFYALMIVASYFGGFGGTGQLAHPYDTFAVAAVALVIYYWGAHTGVPSAKLQLDDDEN